MLRMMNATELETTPLPRGEGYLAFMGSLQIGAGVLTAFFSMLAIAQAWAVNAHVIMSPTEIYQAFGGYGTGPFSRLIAGFISFQAMFGWMLGLVMIGGGICCLRRRGRAWVWLAGVIGLINFPHGTTVAVMVLHGLAQREIAAAFRKS